MLSTPKGIWHATGPLLPVILHRVPLYMPGHILPVEAGPGRRPVSAIGAGWCGCQGGSGVGGGKQGPLGQHEGA